MYQPTRADLDFVEAIIRSGKTNMTEEEIKAELYKAPYTKQEVDDYMVSEQRKNSQFLQKYFK